MTKRTIAYILAWLIIILPLSTILFGCSSDNEVTDGSGIPSTTDIVSHADAVSQTEITCEDTDTGHDFGDWMVNTFTPDRDTMCRFCNVCGKEEIKSAWIPVSELPGHNISEETLLLASKMPEAKYNSLPDWNGVSLECMGDSTEYDPRAWVINKATLDNIKALGFNYCRVGIDAKIFFKDATMQEVNYSMFMNLDNLFTELIKRGIHASFNYNLDFGVDNLANQHTTLFEDPALQEAMLNFWTMMAERYKDVPSNFLDFDLLNEPWAYKSIDQYVDLITEAVTRVRKISPDRLITIEMSNWASDPVPELADLHTIQAFHYYIPNSVENSEKWWTPESVMERTRRYADFSDKYDTAIIVNEFGAHMEAPADEAAAWFDASLDAFDAFNIQWCLTDYGYYFGFSGCDLTGKRPNTPYSVVFEEEYIKYIYPDILEPFQTHMGNTEITLKADDLRKNLYNDPREIIMAPRIHLQDKDKHDFTSNDWLSHTVIENPCYGSSYNLNIVYESNEKIDEDSEDSEEYLNINDYPGQELNSLDIEFLLFGKDYSNCYGVRLNLDINDSYIRYSDGRKRSLDGAFCGSYSMVCMGDAVYFPMYIPSGTITTDHLMDGTLILEATVTNLDELFDFVDPK